MPVKGIDFAWTKPTTAEVKAAGASWAAGYFSTDASKNWTHSLVAEYLAASIAIVTVWETTTTRATQGFAAGVADAHAADTMRGGVGLPSGQIIYFAVDEDTDWATVSTYFAGAAAVIGHTNVGVYGGDRIIEGAYAAGYHYLWQTVAWSSGVWSAHASIRQEGGTLFAGAADIDYAEMPDFGQTPRPSTPEVDMPLTAADVQLILTTKIPEAKLPNGYEPTVQDCLNGAKTADTQLTAMATQITALEAQLTALSTPKLSDAQVAALAAQVVPVLVPAILAALGHDLDGTKP